MEPYSDSELEFIRIEICKKYEEQAISADDIVNVIPQYPRSVGDEKFNFLSEYVEETLLKLAQTSGIALEELDEFRKDNFRMNHSLSATLKKLYCEQHYKKAKEERKTELFKLRSINRFYLYFSGKRRNDFWREKGAAEQHKILGLVQSDIETFQHTEEAEKQFSEQNEASELPIDLVSQMPATESSKKDFSNYPSASAKKTLRFYKIGFLLSAISALGLILYFAAILLPAMKSSQEKLSVIQRKIIRTPAKALDEPGLIGTWYSYNRTPETNDENRLKGTIFRRIEWKIKGNQSGNLVFSRPTAINENEGWIELINMQVNFFMDVHPKFGDKNGEQNFGFRHFICKPNKADLTQADTLFCVCTSFIHKEGRLDDPLASREIIIRKKDGHEYPSYLMPTDSMPKELRAWFPKDKSYLKLAPEELKRKSNF